MSGDGCRANPNSRPTPTLIIGVGNRDRGDDAIGPLVVDAIRERDHEHIETMIVEGDLSDLAMRWHPGQSVVLVDAVHSERPPGTVVTVDGLADTPMVHGRPISSHGVGVPEAIKLARLLNRLPGSLVIYGVEARSFDHFAPLSEPVAAALPGLAQRILEELGAG